jgi:hypothetical protein
MTRSLSSGASEVKACPDPHRGLRLDAEGQEMGMDNNAGMLTKAKQYVYRWLHLPSDTKKTGLTKEERLPFNEYLYWKPLGDHNLWLIKPQGPKFRKEELDELTADFEAEMETWKAANPDNARLSVNELWDRFNYKYYCWLLARWQAKGRKVDCYEAQVGGQQHQDLERGKPFREYEDMESHLSGRVPEVEEDTIILTPERTFLPAQEWLATADCKFQLVAILLNDPEKFEVLMLALEGIELRIPKRTEQKKPMAQRLLLEHEGERLDAKIMTALGLDPTGAKKLRGMKFNFLGIKEHRVASERYRQAVLDLERERTKASLP